MQIEIAEHARMSERGSSLLRLIQNNDMSLLDLLVREAVQNSIDAAKANADFVQVELDIGKFKKESIAENLEGLGDGLKNSFPNQEYEYIKIRDNNTGGLTGPLHIDDVYDDNYGNLLKLVYEISMPQSREGAGGSWGLGKTVYFRIGIGLVFYYSRVLKDDGTYESRLAACMVEDETKDNPLIPSQNSKPKRGIAWWGKRIGENSTIPLTNENEIKEIIEIFDVIPYKENETGTTIIIPFIDKAKLISISDDNTEMPWWTTAIDQYLIVALQRWYAPRLDNINYEYGSWLKAKVNGKEIKTRSMQPVFQIIQSLYNRTFFKNEDLARDILSEMDYQVKDIALRKDLENTRVGKVAYVKVDRQGLLMIPPNNNLPPYEYVNLKEFNELNNAPLISYVRKPGMIVSYETTGRWANGIEKTNPTEYIIGIFVPNSDNKVKSLNEIITLEEYLRKSEKADHTSWSDLNIDGKNMTLVRRIQNATTKAINESYSTKQKVSPSNRNRALSRSLAQYLLPPENFGNRGVAGGENNKGNTVLNKQKKKATFTLENNPRYIQDSIMMDFELVMTKKVKECFIEVHVLSESGGIKGDSWEDDKGIGTKFPIELSEIKINSVNNDNVNVLIADDKAESVSNLELTILKTRRFSIGNGLRVKNNQSDRTLKGNLVLTRSDDFVQGTLVMTFTEVKMK